MEHEDHRRQAEELEADADKLASESERVGDDIDEAQRDLEAKRESGDLPMGERPESTERDTGPADDEEAGPLDSGGED